MEARHILLEALHCPTIVPQTVVAKPQEVLRRNRKANIPQVRGNRQSTLARGEGVVRFACLQKMGEQISRDPPQPMLIAYGSSEDFSFLQIDEDPLDLAQREERTTQVEAEIDGLYLRVRALRES